MGRGEGERKGRERQGKAGIETGQEELSESLAVVWQEVRGNLAPVGARRMWAGRALPTLAGLWACTQLSPQRAAWVVGRLV